MLSRVDALIASDVGHIVMTGATANDRNGWSTASSIANLTPMIDKIVAAGVLLTILLDYPHGAAAFTTMRLANAAGNAQIDH